MNLNQNLTYIGKLWGPNNKQPILALHGWMDNAGSFDHIAPLLKNHSILAIDLPGHGRSSWLPRGIPYEDKIYAKTLRTIVKHFGWNKVKLLGHSMGGITCFNYARLYPQEIEFVVSIDSLSFFVQSLSTHTKILAIGIDEFINFEKKMINDPPSYPMDKAIQKWLKGSQFQSLDLQAVKTLMKRGSKEKEDGTVYFTRDYRLTIFAFNSYHTMQDAREMAQCIKCPYLVIRATDTPFYHENKYWSNVGDVLKNNSKDFCIADVNGAHHVHLTNAQEVADKINPFLDKYNIC